MLALLGQEFKLLLYGRDTPARRGRRIVPSAELRLCHGHISRLHDERQNRRRHTSTFQILDNGQNASGTPQGYAKDKNNVYFHNGDGKVKVLKTADVCSFQSLGDTYFAKDCRHIYAYGKILPKADLNSWKLIGHLYSCDDSHIYYVNRKISAADRKSFRLYTPMTAPSFCDLLARDDNNCYINDEIIDESYWLDRLKHVQDECMSE